MEIVVIGANQATAGVEQRERLAFAPHELGAALQRLGAVAGEGLFLCTCNRVELYALLRSSTLEQELIAILLRGRTDEELRSCLYVHRDAAAVRHLFTVVSGLDSLVLGEDQIIAQVKRALDEARAAGLLGPLFNRLGQQALATGKRVRTMTPIGRSHLSTVSVALRLAAERLGDLRSLSALVVGAGQTGELVLKYLADRSIELALINRTIERAAALAARYSVRALPWRELESALAGVDLVVACTSAPGPVIGAALLARVMARREGRPLLALDLAVPRDVEPAPIPGLELYDLDDLEEISRANRRGREQALAQAEAIIAAQVQQYMAWWRARPAVPTIAGLRARALAIGEAEVDGALARLPDLDPVQRQVVAYVAAAVINKLLHAPITAMKQAADPAATAAVVRQLFDLPVPVATTNAGEHPPAYARAEPAQLFATKFLEGEAP